MKNILARGGIEFLAVLLGITASLWIDKNQEIRRAKEYQITILESIYNDIVQTEKFFKESRDLAFRADSIWMDYLSNNWDDMNVDSVAVLISKEKYSVFHTLFFDFFGPGAPKLLVFQFFLPPMGPPHPPPRRPQLAREDGEAFFGCWQLLRVPGASICARVKGARSKGARPAYRLLLLR